MQLHRARLSANGDLYLFQLNFSQQTSLQFVDFRPSCANDSERLQCQQFGFDANAMNQTRDVSCKYGGLIPGTARRMRANANELPDHPETL